MSVCSWLASTRPGVNGTCDLVAGRGCGLLDRDTPGEHDQIGQ